MRTEVKIGLVICVLIVGIVIATSLFNKDEDAATVSNTDGPKTPAAAKQQPGTTALRVPRKAPDPARPARAIPKTSTAARNTTPPASMRPRYSTPQTVPYKPTTPGTPATPATPGTPGTPTKPASTAKIPSGATGGNAVDFSALKPTMTRNANRKPLPGADTLAPVKLSPPPNNTQLPSRTSTATRPTPKTPVTYVVTKDDTGGFYGISKKLYGSPRYAYLIRNANPDAESTRLRLGQKLRIPSIPDQARRTESPATSSGGKIHVVADGEVAWDLAKKYYGAGKYLYLIERANRSINLNNLKIGQKLIIPNMPKATSATNNGSGSDQVNAAGKRIHTIAANDILGEVSKKYYGTSRLWPAIKRANPGLDENYLIVGKKITIPTKTEALKLLGITEAQLEAAKNYVRPKTETTQTATSTERGQYTAPKPMFD